MNYEVSFPQLMYFNAYFLMLFCLSLTNIIDEKLIISEAKSILLHLMQSHDELSRVFLTGSLQKHFKGWKL